ncbi:MAG TPA: DUF4129 domain-containing protein [Jiangellaceae bacterium]|nr:DUF4129 domain-containing protein [Jiangellaceae bacterium]
MRARSAVTVTALVVAGAGLVAAAVGGTRAVGQLELEFRPLFALPGLSFEVVLLVAALLCIPILLVGRMLHRRRRLDEETRWEWLQRLVAVAAVIAVVLVLRELQSGQERRPFDGDDGGLEAPAGASDVLGWSGWIGILALGLTVVASAMLWWRARAARRGTSTPAALDRDDGLDAIAAGRAALDEPVGGPRVAVVACYAAMEATLNSAGSGRRPAESPEEFLARTVAEGRLPAEPGRRLTRLFLAARYSSAPVTAADVAAGREALSRIDAGVRS